MLSPVRAYSRSLLLLAVVLACPLDAEAATGIKACDDRIPGSAEMTLVDYDSAPSSDTTTDLLRDAPGIDAKPLVLTPRIDTTIRRDDNVGADIELPTERPLNSAPDAAALLLERRDARLKESADEAPAEMNTELPGMDQDEMMQFREQMYRTDI